MNAKPRALPALIVIDVQRAFDIWDASGERRNQPDAIHRIADLLAAFRTKGAPIFRIRHLSDEPDARLVRDAAWTYDRRGPDGELHRAEDIHAMTLANLDEEFARIVTTAEMVAALG